LEGSTSPAEKVRRRSLLASLLGEEKMLRVESAWWALAVGTAEDRGLTVAVVGVVVAADVVVGGSVDAHGKGNSEEEPVGGVRVRVRARLSCRKSG